MAISYLHVIRFQMETKKVATIMDLKLVTMLLEEKIYMINNFDTDNQCFHFWKHKRCTDYLHEHELINK